MSAQAQAAPGFAKNPGYRIGWEPSPRRVRVVFNGETVADTTHAVLMLEQAHLPVYYFPWSDIRRDLLVRTTNKTHCPFKGEAAYWSINAGGKVSENAVWSYPEPYAEMRQIKDHAAFYWNRVDHWYEEDEEVFVHARDPYKRVDVVLSHRPVKVVVGGQTVAETTNARFLFETGLPTRYYIPRDDVRMDLLAPSATRTRCPYKGEASYWSAAGYPDIAWCYEDPIPECPKIKGLICFFNENVDAIAVDGQETPKPRTKWSREQPPVK